MYPRRLSLATRPIEPQVPLLDECKKKKESCWYDGVMRVMELMARWGWNDENSVRADRGRGYPRADARLPNDACLEV